MSRIFRALLVVPVALMSVSCGGDALRNGQSPVVLVVNSLLGASGGGHAANTFGGTLFSDVQVLVTSPAPCTQDKPCPTIFSDVGQVTLSLAPKNISIAPTVNNQVTITRYHVQYVRADGRNVQGVDVPYAFDGAVSGVVPPTGSVQLGFELVRHTAKMESPLVQLITSPQIISTIANVTFYGQDATGNAISVTGSISIEFGNFGDS